MTEYGSSGHAVSDMKYHLIWITKYRYKVLRGGWRSGCLRFDTADASRGR